LYQSHRDQSVEVSVKSIGGADSELASCWGPGLGPGAFSGVRGWTVAPVALDTR
jgi:hypothetical protein